MKKSFFSVIIFFVFILCGCTQKTFFATDENFVKIMNNLDDFYIYEIDSKVEGNFTNSGYKEILVFFNGKHKKHNESRFWDALVFIVDEQNEIVNFYKSFELYKKKPLSNFNFIKEIDKFEIKFDNAVITDFNGNGLLEFIYFESAGSVYQFFICEFKNGNFEYICQNYNPELNIPGLYNYILEHFDFEEKSMYLRSLTDNEIIKLKWNEETQFYDKEILSEMHTQLESKLTDSDLTTWCNMATQEVTFETSYNLSMALRNENDPYCENTNANDMYDNLMKATQNPNSSIVEITPQQAQALANQGFTVAGSWKNSDPTKSGHIATLESGYEYDPEKGPVFANVGVSDFTGNGQYAINAFGKDNYQSIKYYYDKNQFKNRRWY